MRIGLDFGTSNTSAAMFDGKAVRYIPLDSANPDDSSVLNSVLFVYKQGDYSFDFKYGADAVNGYQKIMIEGQAELERQEIGDLSMHFADDQTVTVKGYGMVEVDQPGRMFQYLKKFLGKNIQTSLYGIDFKVHELIAQVLKYVKHQIEIATNQPVTSVLAGRPVRFSDDAEAEKLAFTDLKRAFHLAGFEDIEFQYEPVAASYHYSRNTLRGENVVIFDIGAGTSDITVARVENGRTEILGLAGIALGGSDFDKEIMYQKITPFLGRGKRYKGVWISDAMYRKAGTWQLLPQIAREVGYRSPVDYLRKVSPDKNLFEAFDVLVTEEHGFPIFQAIEKTKKQLTHTHASQFIYDLAISQINTEISRQSFSQMITPYTDQIFNTLDEALKQAGVTSDGINRVIRVGGSARIPCIHDQLIKVFGEEKIMMKDELKNVVAGLAIEAFESER